MSDPTGKDFIGFSTITLNGNQQKSTPILQNPEVVAQLYRNAMKMPGEILVSQVQPDTKPKHQK